jgi:hypothetical protein
MLARTSRTSRPRKESPRRPRPRNELSARRGPRSAANIGPTMMAKCLSILDGRTLPASINRGRGRNVLNNTSWRTTSLPPGGPRRDRGSCIRPGLSDGLHFGRPSPASVRRARATAPAPETPSVDWDGHGPIVFAASCNEASNAIARATIGEPGWSRARSTSCMPGRIDPDQSAAAGRTRPFMPLPSNPGLD